MLSPAVEGDPPRFHRDGTAGLQRSLFAGELVCGGGVPLARRGGWTAHGHTVVVCQGVVSGFHPMIALHVALRDPACVLREVEAKRGVLARHVLSPAGESRRGKSAILTLVDYDCRAFAESGVEV
ncbi:MULTISPECIES: DUF6221 family protein [unclassified Streptomyces]|uniref:DUF6221 family protein n=1 Tax=unclassified Streptomyces TaxID=2593676 RepID=UPI0035DED87B